MRKQKLLTQPQLAKLVRIDQSTLSDIERGAGFSAETLMRLCAALETTPQHIMAGEDERAWPFSIPYERFAALTDRAKGIVEGRLIAEIEAQERNEPPPPLSSVGEPSVKELPRGQKRTPKAA